MAPLTDILELSRKLQNKELSAIELAEAYTRRIGDLNPGINAFITVTGEILKEQARESDRRRAAGKALSPYDGIPLGIKDNIITSGIPTTCASRMLEQFVPQYNATAYEKLLAAGFLTAGKTNMDEFAMGSSTETSYFGQTKNPWDTARVPGGSSGGSAAAVAAAMVPGALGSDTGGSIRQPAAFCGVTGIKPTYGLVSRYGLVAFASSLDQIGPFAGKVSGAAALLEVISGHDNRDSTSVNRNYTWNPGMTPEHVRGMKIGIPEEYFAGVNEEISTAVRKAIARLESLGAVPLPISLKYIDYAVPVYYLIATAEASSNLARFDGVRYGYRAPGAGDIDSLYLKSRSEGFGPEVKRRIILGTFALSSGYYDAYYLQALKGRKIIIDDFRKAFETVDVIVSPVTTTTAFKLNEMINDPLEMYRSDILTISANLAGIPALSLPVGCDSKGLPIGLQIMGNHFMEDAVFKCALAVERDVDMPSPRL